MGYEYLVVGAGLTGCVIAERLASLKKTVLVIDKRSHIGGNCASKHHDGTGIQYHRYGPHIFHTDNKKIWEYINRFSFFNNYKHYVYAKSGDDMYTLPINLETINKILELNMCPTAAKNFFKGSGDVGGNFRERGLKRFGPDIYNKFFENYTKKQWGKSPTKIDGDVIERIPMRFNYNRDYFNNATYQGIPEGEYNELFENIVAHEKIKVILGTQFKDFKYRPAKKIIYTGCIDEYFDYEFGKLDYRGVKFEIEEKPVEDYQGTSVINYVDSAPEYTRICEPKHFHPESLDKFPESTIIIKEYPTDGKYNPCYPINSTKMQALYSKYKKRALEEENVVFAGRLGTYSYMDMDKAIENAMILVKEIENG